MAEGTSRSTENGDVEETSQQTGSVSESASQTGRSEMSSESQLSSVAESSDSQAQSKEPVEEVEAPSDAASHNASDQGEETAGSKQAEPEQETTSDGSAKTSQEQSYQPPTAVSPPPKPVESEATPAASKKRPAKTMVGGLLASSKTMKPFRSPVVGRPASASDTSASTSTDTPTRGSTSAPTSKDAPRPIINPFRSTPTSRSSANKALNKPFVSPVVRSSSTSISTSTDSSDIPMTSFQLNSALPVLERRLANLKNAKRYLKAIELDLQTSDNTTHILQLSTKWLNAGREASEWLWELTKDSYQNEEGAQANDSGYSNGRFGENKGSSWGWQATDVVKERTDATTKELENMSDRDREEAIRYIEDEDARDPLPDSPQEILSRASSRSSSSTNLKRNRSKTSTSSTSNSQARPNKLARLQEDTQEADEDIRSEEEVEQESMEVDPEVLDNPNGRGMAKMLLQCGIDLKTFGWDAGKEEWDTKNDRDD